MSTPIIDEQVYQDFRDMLWLGRPVDEVIAEFSASRGIDPEALTDALIKRFGNLEEFAFQEFNSGTKPDHAQN